MKIILHEDVRGLGRKFDVKDLKEGYIRNFLQGRYKFVVATEEELAKLKEVRALLESKKKKNIEELKETALKISNLKLSFKLRRGRKGEAFGSISKTDIKDKLNENGFGRLEIDLQKPIKSFGESKVTINLGEGVKAEALILIESEE